MKAFITLLFCSLLFLHNISYASTLVGTSVVNGKKVQFFSDGTWKFSDDNSLVSDCSPIWSTVYFCNDELNWRDTKAVGNLTAQYFIDDRHYAAFVVEKLGADDGITLDLYAEVALETAAAAMNISVPEVVVVNREEIEVNGYKYLSMIYSGEVRGINVVYINNMFIGEHTSFQAITYGLGDQLTSKLERLNSQFLENIRIEG